jgi:hypothetical protein
MRDQVSYNAVFSSKLPIEIWPVLVDVYKAIDRGLDILTPGRRGERFANTWRPLIALIVVSRRLKKFSYTPAELVDVFYEGKIEGNEVVEVWEVIASLKRSSADKKRFKSTFAIRCCNEAAAVFGLDGQGEVGKRTIPYLNTARLPQMLERDEFLSKVEALLPAQPWKPGVHIEIASKLGCAASVVSAAIQLLIADRKRYMQVDGVVYDHDGKVVAVDTERIQDEET